MNRYITQTYAFCFYPFTGGRFSHKRGVGPPEIKALRSSLGRFVPESDEIKVQDAVGQIDSHTDQHDAAKEVQNAQGLLSPLALEPAGGELSEGPGYDQHDAVAQRIGKDQAEGEQEPARGLSRSQREHRGDVDLSLQL